MVVVVEVRSYSDSRWRWGKTNGELAVVVVVIVVDVEKRRGKTGRRIGSKRRSASESPLVAVDTCPLGEEREREAVICLARKEVQFL